MEVDLYKIYELLNARPSIELRFEAGLKGLDGIGALHIRAINFDAIAGPRQRDLLLPWAEMASMRGKSQIMTVLEDMIKDVGKEDYEWPNTDTQDLSPVSDGS